MKKRKTSKSLPSSLIALNIYGIWSKEDKRIIFVGLNQEEVEAEYEFEAYNEETHVMVQMITYYDISNLESQAP